MSKSSSLLAHRYVDALLQAGANVPLQHELQDLVKMIENSSDLRFVLASPLMGADAQTRAVLAVMKQANLSAALMGFVRVVLQNRRGAMLHDFVVAALAEIEKRAGIVRARVDVATPMNDTAQKKLVDTLSNWTGAKVQLDIRVANDVIAGARVRVGDVQIDDTVAGKLARLKQKLVG